MTASPSDKSCLFETADLCAPQREAAIWQADRPYADPVAGFEMDVPEGWVNYLEFVLRFAPEPSRMVRVTERDFPDDFVSVHVSTYTAPFRERRSESRADDDDKARRYDSRLGPREATVWEIERATGDPSFNVIYLVSLRRLSIEVTLWTDTKEGLERYRSTVDDMVASIREAARSHLGKRVAAFVDRRLNGSNAERFLSPDPSRNIEQKLYGWERGTSLKEWSLIYGRDSKGGLLVDVRFGFAGGPDGGGAFWERFYMGRRGLVTAGDTIQAPGTS